MSVALKIFFDASIRNGVIGIGVYDFNNKEKVFKTLEHKQENSYEAEMLALYSAMEYSLSSNKKTNVPMYFTDNMDLYNKGIPKDFEERFGKGLLFWIPRELNTIADDLSKDGSLVAATSIEEMIEYGKNNEINQRNIIVKLKTYSLTKRVNLLKKFFPEYCEFLDLFINPKGTSPNKKINGEMINKYISIEKSKRETFKSLLSWINTIISRGTELSQSSRKQINKFYVHHQVLKTIGPKSILKELEKFNTIKN